jgi:hypothetical protein
LDWLRLTSLTERVPLDIDRYPTGERSPVWDTISTHLVQGGHRALTLIAEEQNRILALGQAVPRDSAWHVARLLTRGRMAESDQAAVLTSILAALAEAVALRGAQRLQARLERRADAVAAVVRAGFVPYSYESVYVLANPSTGRNPAGEAMLRPQDARDAWGIYQLYCAVTPRIVQQAEGIDASRWDASSLAASALQKVGEKRWVMELDGEILGYVQIARLGRRLQLLVHPKAYGFARQMIACGAGELRGTRPIRCCVPEYQGELGRSLEDEGFAFVGTQVVLSRQLAGLVRNENRVARPVREPSLEPARTVSKQ